MAQNKVKGRQVSVNLSDLADVAALSPVNGEVLTYNAGTWSPEPTADPTAFITVEDDVLPHFFALGSVSNFNAPLSNSSYVLTPTGPIVIGSTLTLTNSASFQEYLLTFGPTVNAEIRNGFLLDFTVERINGSIGAAWSTIVQLSPTNSFGFGYGSFTIMYQSHSVNPLFIDSFRVRDDNNADLLVITGDGLWATATTSRRILANVVGTSLELTIQGVAAGSFIVGRQYKIATVGTTDFTLIGASANTVGTTFTATGAGTGSGTADVFYVVTLPNTINIPDNRFFRLSINGGGSAGSGTGPDSPGDTPARFTNLTVQGSQIDPLSLQLNAAPAHDAITFPNLYISQGVGEPIAVRQQSIEVQDALNPYGNFDVNGVQGDYPNTNQRNATTQVIFNEGLHTTISGTSNEVITVDAGMTTNNAPWLQLYHFNNIDGGPNDGIVTERITGAQLNSEGFPQVTPAEYGASALHINAAPVDNLALLTTLPFAQWTWEFSLRKISTPPILDGTIFLINAGQPYQVTITVQDNVYLEDWDLRVENASLSPVYTNATNPMDVYIKWAVQVDLVENLWSLHRNGVQVFSGPAVGGSDLLQSAPATIPWNIEILALGGGESGPTDNGVLLDELRLTPRLLYPMGQPYTPATAEFPVTDVFEAATITHFPNMQVTPYSAYQVAVEPQHLVVTDGTGTFMELPSGNPAIPRTMIFSSVDFTLTPSGPDNEELLIESNGGGGSISAPAFQAVIGHEGSVNTVSVVDPASGLGNGTFAGVQFYQDVDQLTNAGAFIIGRQYKIATIGTTDFTLIGANTNTVGITFTATGVGSGTGSATFANTGSLVIGTVTIAGGVVTSVQITNGGYGYFAGMQLTDLSGFSGYTGPIVLNVDTVHAGTVTSPNFFLDTVTGSMYINWDPIQEESRLLPAGGITGDTGLPHVSISALSARNGDGADYGASGGNIIVLGGRAEYGSGIYGGGIYLSAGSVDRPSLYRGAPSLSMNGPAKDDAAYYELNGGQTFVYLNGVRTFTNLVGGSGYTPGNYSEVPLVGGSGQGVSANIVVNGSGVVQTVTVVHPGYGYALTDTGLDDGGSYLGPGTGFSVDVDTLLPYDTTLGVTGLDPRLMTPGSGYTPGTYYAPLLGGTGVGATAYITVGLDGTVDRVVLANPGGGYGGGNVLTTDFSIGAGSGFSVTVNSAFTHTEDIPLADLLLTAASLNVQGGNQTEILGSISGGAITLNTDSIDRLKIMRNGAWEVAGDPGEHGMNLTSNGLADSPVWDYGTGLFNLQSTGSTVFDGSLFSTWNGGQTSSVYGCSFADLTPGGVRDVEFFQGGFYEVAIEVQATPTTVADWPSNESVYGTEITFPFNDPALIWQRKQHSRYVATPGALPDVQTWTDVYHINILAQLASNGAGELATNLQAGFDYRIADLGTTDFTLVGAAFNIVGQWFTATGAGTGTGIVDSGNFIMRINAYAESDAGTEAVQFHARVAIRRMGPMIIPA